MKLLVMTPTQKSDIVIYFRTYLALMARMWALTWLKKNDLFPVIFA